MGPAFLAFAEKPAPVQVSWIGMVSSTGLTAMDYFLGDPHLPCPGAERLFSETVYRLPVLSVIAPLKTSPLRRRLAWLAATLLLDLSTARAKLRAT